MASDRKRKSLSKKTRFEVFKRDSFTCQYCGRAAPDVILQADHIDPVAAGGGDDLMNLVTSCLDCNAGKAARSLDDSSVLAKQRAQLEELGERREQLAMMLAWREELKSIDEYAALHAIEYWNKKIAPRYLNDYGVRSVEETVAKVGIKHTLDAMDATSERNFKYDCEGMATLDSVNFAFNKIAGMAAVLKSDEKDPGFRERLYIRGILKNRLGYVNEHRSLQLMKQAQKAGIELEEIKDLAKEAGSWTHFRETLERWISEQE